MPEISRFFGIVIRMYYDDHNPPHFHAIYSGRETKVGIDPIIAALHQRELLDNWSRLRSEQAAAKIDPLA